MDIVTIKLPDISNYMQFTQTCNLNNNITIVLVFKTMFRSDNVYLDIYLNDISVESKIISSRLLTKNSLISLPNRDIDFPYNIHCIDQDSIQENLTRNNLYKFYMYFTSYNNGDLK